MSTKELLGRILPPVQEELARRERVAGYFSDPVEWARYMLGIELWAKQKEIARDVVHSKSVAVKAGHGVGKSFLMAVLITWWIDTRHPNAFVASTAPSTSQIDAVVWSEVRKMYATIERRFNDGVIDHKLPGQINAKTEWKTDDGIVIGFGRKPPDKREDDRFQGIHRQYVLAIGDEAVGLSEDLIDALGNITTNEGSRRVLVCNPTNPLSYVGKIFKDSKGKWSLHTISVFDSPNFIGNPDNLDKDALEALVGPTYVEEKKQEYGENSARYKARVLGEFAFDMGETLFKEPDLAKAKDTHIVPSSETRPVLGADIARFGDDSSVVYSMHDGRLRFVEKWEKSPTTDTALRIHRIAIDTGAKEVRVDASGVGGGVADELVRLSEGRYLVIQMLGQAASPDRKQWFNARAYNWDMLRLDMSKGKIDVDPEDERLNDELLSVEYKFAPTGGLLIESKDDMRKRNMKSPDFADAAVYASADLSVFLENPYLGMNPGDVVRMDAEEFGVEQWATALPW